MNRSRVTGNLSSHGNIFVDIANDRVGIGSTIPGQKLSLPDNARIALGNSADTHLYHDGTLGHLQNNTGHFVNDISGSFYVRNLDGAKSRIIAKHNAEVELFHNGNMKLETAVYGVTVTGTTDTDGLVVSGVTTADQGVRVNADSSQPSGNSATNYLSVGASQDLKLYHNGNQNYITAADGTLLIQADNIMLVSDDTAGRSLYQDNANSRLELGFDGTAAAYFSSSAIQFVKPVTTTGDVTVGSGGENSALGVRFNSAYAQIKLPDGQTGANRKGNLSFGDNDDFRIVHDGHHNYITSGAGDIYISNTGGTAAQIYNDRVNLNVDLILTDTATDSAAGPEFKLFRNSASPADADYLGQIKFAGESDTGVERNYAKITGKILDASNGTEDGIIEFAHIKAGSQVITGRWRSDSLQLLNSTNFSVAGTSEFTGSTSFIGGVTANTITIRAHAGINFTSGNWSGNQTKIQNHNNYLYLVAPTNGFQFRIGATDLWLLDSISNDGNFWPTVDSGRDIGKSNRRIRNLYATTLYGDGSNLTGITQTAINNNADNRVITGSGTANTLNAESGLTYDGTTLQIAAADDIRIAGGTWTGEYTGGIKIQPDATNSYFQYHGGMYFRNASGANRVYFDSAGNTTIVGNLTVNGGISGSGASITGVNATTLDSIDSGSFLRSDASDAVTNYNHNIEFHSNTSINSASGNQASLEVYQSTSHADAFMSFHVSGDFALYFGLDGGTNKLSVGGWSMGANSYAIYHEGNNPTFSQLGITASNINALGINATTLDSIDSGSFLRSDAADTTTERVSFHACNTHNYDTIATSSGSQGALEVYNNGVGNDAFMTFHAGGDFAFYLGLDADTNDLSVGGWSMGANKYRVWHAGNDGSGSGLDADTLDGYNQSDSAGNNTIVRRNSSGYVFANYFNTTTDDTGGTSDVTRFYCSQDAYIRYIDKNSMRSCMNVSANSRAYGGRESSTSDQNYWIGSTGWGTTGFDTLWNYGSCFFDTWSNPSGQPSGTSHWTGLQAMHYNAGSQTNSYGLRIICGAGNPALAYIQGQWGSTGYSWSKLWNAANDGSGSGLDADLLDGVEGSNYLRSNQSDTLSGTLTVTYGVHFTNNNSWSGETCKVVQHSNYLYMVGGSNGHVFRRSSGNDAWYISSSGHLYPAANDTYDLGTSGSRIRNIYTSDLNMSNEGSQNDVDGTWGSYTIQEGEDDLFLINRRSGKKYKFNLTEVS